MSHHYSGPDFGFPHGDAGLDFTYAIEQPANVEIDEVVVRPTAQDF